MMKKSEIIERCEQMLISRCTPKNISELKENEVFVFGSKPDGHHKSGAAKLAVEKFGAIEGNGCGFAGQSYAVPVHKHRVGKMYEAVRRFIEFAKKNSDKIFYVLPIGCGKAGMDILTVATMFRDAIGVENIYMPKEFILTLQKSMNQNMTDYNFNKGQLLHSESFGSGLQWNLYGSGMLEITGYGAIPNYINHWDSYFGEGQPKWIGCERYGVLPYRLMICKGITYVGENAFESFGCLKEVYLADSVTGLGKMAFFDCFHIERINIPSNMNIEDFEKAELPLFYNNSYVRVKDWIIDQSIM